MISRTKISKYASLTLFIVSLVALNVFVTTRSMDMSQKALEYESEIKSLREENVKIEGKLTTTSSFRFIADVAKSAGYVQESKFIHLPAPVFAQR